MRRAVKSLYVDWCKYLLDTLWLSCSSGKAWQFALFVPASSHWYLAVICFAGQEDPVFVNEINDEDDDETDTKVHFAVDKMKILKLYSS